MSILGNFSAFLTSVLALFMKMGVVQDPAAPFKRPAPQERGGLGSQKSAGGVRKKEQTFFSSPRWFDDKPFSSAPPLQSSSTPAKRSRLNLSELGLSEEPSGLLRKASKKQSQNFSMNNQIEGGFSGDQFEPFGFSYGFTKFPSKFTRLASSVSPLPNEMELPETSEEETRNAFADALVQSKRNLKNTGGISALEQRLQLKKSPAEAAETLQKADAPVLADPIPTQKKAVDAPAELEELEIFKPVLVEKQEIWRQYIGFERFIDLQAEQKELPSEPAAPVEEVAADPGPEFIEEGSYRYHILTAANALKDNGIGGIAALEEKLERKFKENFFSPENSFERALEELFGQYLASRKVVPVVNANKLKNERDALEDLEKLLNKRRASRGVYSVANADETKVTLEDLEEWFNQHLASKKSAPVEEAILVQENKSARVGQIFSKPPVEALETLQEANAPARVDSVPAKKQLVDVPDDLEEMKVPIAQEPASVPVLPEPKPEMKKPALGGLLGEIVSFGGFKQRPAKPSSDQNSDKDLIAEASKTLKIKDTREEIEKEIERLEKLNERLKTAIEKKNTEGFEADKLESLLPDVKSRLTIFNNRLANFVEEELNSSFTIRINEENRIRQTEEEAAQAEADKKSELEKQITKISRNIDKLEKSNKEEDKEKAGAEKTSLAALHETYKSRYKHHFIVEPLKATEDSDSLFKKLKAFQPKEEDLNSSFNSDWD